MKTPTSSSSRSRSRCCATSRSTSSCRRSRRRRSPSSATAPTPRCWSASRRGRGRSSATPARPTATRPFQLAWDNSFLQPPAAGGLTLYSGGKLALDGRRGHGGRGGGAADARHRTRLSGRHAQSATARCRGSTGRRSRGPRAAYSCYKPGQWTTIAGAEGLPVGNLFFAGEHCSYDFQGYMNGAAQSGADTAKAVMAKLSGSALRHAPRRWRSPRDGSMTTMEERWRTNPEVVACG